MSGPFFANECGNKPESARHAAGLIATSTTRGYEIRDSAFTLIGYAEELVAARGPDAVGIAKQHGKDCIVVRCSDAVALLAYGTKPGRLLARWRGEMMPGVARAAA